MNKIQHLQSATQLVTLSGVSILTDPWLTDGEYYGSWYHVPKFPEPLIDELKYDFIYVSHIHPDHCSQDTFAKLDPSKKVLIPKFQSSFLKRKIEAFGFTVEELQHAKPKKLFNDLQITIYLADNCNPELCGRYFGCAISPTQMSPNIDSLALIESHKYRILNTNDCPYELAKHTIKENNLDDNIDFLSVGYAGAGPYPQCFEFPTLKQQEAAAAQKEKQFIKMAANFIDLIKPRYFAPFAGTYMLGGGLTKLNSLRGVPSVQDATTRIASITQEPDVSGLALNTLDVFNLDTKKVDKTTTNNLDINRRLSEIKQTRVTLPVVNADCELIDLLCVAHTRFSNVCKQNNVTSTTQIFLQTEDQRFSFSTFTQPSNSDPTSELTEPYLKISLNEDLLRCILSGPKYAHWNNALIGSHLQISRYPDVYERDLFHCLNFLHV